MSARPLLLDLFCKAGGAGMGYHRAGFDVVGVDIEPQPNYPFEFHRADALKVLRDLLVGGTVVGRALGDIAAIHGSPPCQHYSAITLIRGNPTDHPDLIEPTRELLVATRKPYVIENVVRAPLQNAVVLCGVAMGLTIVENGVRYVARRHRLFESNVMIMVPPCACRRGMGTVLGIYGGGTRQDTRKRRNTRGGNTSKANRAQARALMDMPWATREEINQAIPPAYTEHIGGYLMAAVLAGERKAAA